MQITIDPREENPSTLRAVALLLNSIASDRDGLTAGHVVERSTTHRVGELSRTVTEVVVAGNDQTPPPPPPVVGASDNSTPPPPPVADANSDATTYSANDLDANGLPWIEAIHSSSKNRNADNTWRYLRGGDPAERARVEAEVRAKMAGGNDAPPPPPIIDAPAADQTPPPPPPLTDAPADTATTQPATGTVFSLLSKMSAEDRLTALETVSLKSPAEFLKEVKVRPEVATELLKAINMIQGDE